MSRQSRIEQRTEEILTPIAASNGVTIYDVEYVKEGPDYYLTCYIDKEGGVNIGDCEAVSRALSDAIDAAEEYIPDAYTLQVSSPGLGRALTRDRHYANSIGQEVEGTCYRPLEGTRVKTFTGILEAFDKDTVTLVTQDPQGGAGTSLVLDRKNIARIRLTVDF